MDITSPLLSIWGGKYHGTVIYYTCNPMIENIKRIDGPSKNKLSYF